MIPLLAGLAIGKKLFLNKYVICITLFVGMFVAGYLYRGSVEKGRQARVIVKEVIKYVESTEKIRRRYDNIDIPDNIELIMCGQISIHSRPAIPRYEGSEVK